MIIVRRYETLVENISDPYDMLPYSPALLERIGAKMYLDEQQFISIIEKMGIKKDINREWK